MILGIYGAGGLGREIYEFATAINKRKQRWEDMVFIDDGIATGTIGEVDNYHFNDIKQKFSIEKIEIVIAQGEPLLREMLANKVESSNYTLATLVHPDCFINNKVDIKPGVIINSDKLTISPNVVINKNVLIQPFVAIGHDTVIGENCVISAFSSIAGGCDVGKNTYMGMHAAIKEKITVGNNVVIGMGAMVTRNVPESHTVFTRNTKMVEHEPGTKVFR